MSFIAKFTSKNTSSRALGRTPDAACAYVIGDVHGCLAKLKSLISKIELHALDQNNIEHVKIIFLGDLIDRGPSSYEVIEFLMNEKLDFAEIIFLMGNHEEIFLEVLNGNSNKIAPWFEHGGMETARSYGIENLGEVFSNPERLLARIQQKVPSPHIDFISNFQDYYILGGYLCVHAGLRPRKPLRKQKSRDMHWIREPFLSFQGNFSHKVIHGHSIVKQPQILHNRIAIDTGAYTGSALTAAYLDGSRVSFLQSGT